MEQALEVYRLHFAFTIHVSLPRSSADDGLALLLVYLKTRALPTRDTRLWRVRTRTHALRGQRVLDGLRDYGLFGLARLRCDAIC